MRRAIPTMYMRRLRPWDLNSLSRVIEILFFLFTGISNYRGLVKVKRY
jgi:hypothetical protein